MSDHQQHSGSYPQGYGQYQQQPARQAQATPGQAQTQAQGSTPQQSTARTPYAPAGSYSYDQSSQAYGYQPLQQQAQQQSHQQGQQPQSQIQASSANQQYAQPIYQPQQQYSSAQFQSPYATSGYPMQPGAYAAPGQAPGSYPFTPYGLPQGSNHDNSPYKNQSQLSAGGSGANINMAQIRGPLQSATQPPMIDPNQVPQRPKLTTTFWEDENTVCYQVEARGISVSRREDTNFINGTKLLNVAGMTRGRRDGILKSEKVRYVVKIGAMNLKGVWIPFERALELARNEGIVDLLYPLFVKDIKELYQGPQYSGGLTAAANSNPKNIVPVTVTNTSYTTAIYPPKEKKSSGSAASNPVTASTDSTAQQSTTAGTTSGDAAHPQQYQYGGYQSYPYAAQEGYQYGKSYYGYPPGAPQDAIAQAKTETGTSPEQK